MNAKEIREKTNEELLKEIDALKDELFNLRFQQATGQLENTARLKTVKKTICSVQSMRSPRKVAPMVTVAVETKKTHPIYGKRVKYTKKYKAHDENNVAREGDVVTIMETRPLSATKRFRLLEVVEKAEG